MSEERKTAGDAEHQHDEPHVVPLSYYYGVFAVLVVGTILTYVVATVDLDGMLFPGANTLVALLIAFFKMSCVVLIFMHVRWSSRLIWLTDCRIFLAGDYVCLYDAGLFDARRGRVYPIEAGVLSFK
jgi:cytochrome c oxidase subunit 4